jgi:hypothetical protein
MSETLIFGPVSVKFRSINSIQFPVEALSTFYHLKSLIALPIQMIRMIRTLGGGGGHTPIPPKVSPLHMFTAVSLPFHKALSDSIPGRGFI